jgi:hypothetical protein
MAATESQTAVLRPQLRWYQFSLRGLLLFTSFVAVLLSVLAIGRTSPVYKASLAIQWLTSAHCCFPRSADELFFMDAEKDMAFELATSDAVMEAVAQSLRQQGVEKLDGEDISSQVLSRNIVVEHAERNRDVYIITTSSSDPEVSRTIARTHYETWRGMIPELAPTMEQRYLERAKLVLSASDFPKFEFTWRDAMHAGYFSEITGHSNGPPRIMLMGGECPETFDVGSPIYPHWNRCLAFAILGLVLGILAFGIDRWR